MRFVKQVDAVTEREAFQEAWWAGLDESVVITHMVNLGNGLNRWELSIAVPQRGEKRFIKRNSTTLEREGFSLVAM
jgi:hypothetical protein